MLTVHPSFIEAKILTRNSFNKIEMIMLFNNFSREENISFCSGLLCLSPLSFSLCIYKHVCEWVSECVSVPPYFMHFFILKSPPFRPSLFCPYNSDTFSRFSRTHALTHMHSHTHALSLASTPLSLSLSWTHTHSHAHSHTCCVTNWRWQRRA